MRKNYDIRFFKDGEEINFIENVCVIEFWEDSLDCYFETFCYTIPLKNFDKFEVIAHD